MPSYKYFDIPGLILIIPQIFNDSRGYFFESYNDQWLQELNLDVKFVQDNESCSSKGVVRGLHFQMPPFAQGKLVRVISGKILDVAVDIRVGSPYFGQHIAIELSAENKHLFYIPPGFAHGFAALEDHSIVHYKCTDFYNNAAESCIFYNDHDINIDWKTLNPQVSAKDLNGTAFSSFVSPFVFS